MADIVHINALIDGVEKLLSENEKLSKANQDVINIKTFNAREMFINQLAKLSGVIDSLNKKISSSLESTKKLHAIETETITSLIGRKKSSEDNWSKVVRKAGRPNLVMSLSPLVKSTEIILSRALIPITPQLSVSAIKIPSLGEVRGDGELYYVELIDHFAVKINGCLFHGNVGDIFTDGESPTKIKDCRFAGSCTKQHECAYYHDPMLFNGSRDRRNYVAGSFLYISPANRRKGEFRGRQFGSKSNLDTDLQSITREDIARYHDQTMHDILCSIILSNI